ncbi:MAG: hypothetical protein NXI31_02020 [bacterium]|nr:hypothetical protein [bacterium]
MARRSSAARSSRSRTTGSRSGSGSGRSGSGRSGRSSGGRASATRSDGRVDAPCPQCGTRYRVSEEALDTPLECQACHRVFIPKTTAGKRVAQQDNTKVYVGFGIGALLLVITFVLMSGGNDEPVKKKPKVKAPPPLIHTVGTHPRTQTLVRWAQGFHSGTKLTISTVSDLPALAKMIEMEDADTASNGDIVDALLKHKSTQWLRDIKCEAGSLSSEAAMKSATGNCTLYLVPEPGNKDYRNDDRAELDVAFRADGDSIKVTGWTIARHIRRLTPDPNRKTIKVNKHIKKAETVKITDSAGTRDVMESEPGPVPHWEKADAVMRAKVDEVIAGVLRSADNDGPPLARFTLKIRSLEDRKAAVPRALNAMYELYGDVNANKMKLSQLDRALRDWTGFATNFQVRESGDAARDKKERESCVRQWFGFWWRFSETGLEDFFDMRENLDEPLEGEEEGKGK